MDLNREQAKHKQNGMDGGKQNERGKMMRRAVGVAGKSPQNRHCRANTAGGLSARHRPFF